MNPEIKRRWVQALRSGEFKQGRGRLSSLGADGVRRYCCLGVLCEIAVKDSVITSQDDLMGNDRRYGPSADTGLLPVPVMEWAGLSSSNPCVSIPMAHGARIRSLATLNDGGDHDFSQIADLIEAQL